MLANEKEYGKSRLKFWSRTAKLGFEHLWRETFALMV
jgi:hypothetical protein